MLHYVAEDAWPLVLTCGGVAVLALMALQLTQQGKFLVVALAAAGLAVLAFTVEALWVTDDERIGDVVYDLTRAAGRGDVDRVLTHLAPEVVLSQGPAPPVEPRTKAPIAGELARGTAARDAIAATLRATKFDWIVANRLEAHADAAAGVGTASFRVIASGSIAATHQYNFATDAGGSDWSLGFRQTSPGTWQVTRITAVRLPFNAQLPLVTGAR